MDTNWPQGHLPKRSIIIDTREQLPYEFPDSIRQKLDQGDYSLREMEHVVAVERKSIQDLVGSLTSGRKRFEREMERLQSEVRWPWLLVESSVSQIAAGGFMHSKANPRSILGSLFAWTMRYGVLLLPACDRAHAQASTAMILRLAETELERE